jgi:hypothetical protein
MRLDFIRYDFYIQDFGLIAYFEPNVRKLNYLNEDILIKGDTIKGSTIFSAIREDTLFFPSPPLPKK